MGLILIGGGLIFMVVSTIVLYSCMIIASREDEELEKLLKRKEDGETEI